MIHRIHEVLAQIWKPEDEWYRDPETSEFTRRWRFGQLVEMFRAEDAAWLAENVRGTRIMDDY